MFRSGILASLLVLPTLAVLLGLGIWQLDRLAWKRDLIETMDQRMAEAPMDLAGTLALPVPERAWRPVRAVGTFLNSREMPLYRQAVEDGAAGYHILTPLLLPGGRAVLVNRGWVPPEKRDDSTRSPGPEGQVWVTGTVRDIGDREAFANDNSPSTDEWYWIDLDAMSAYAGIDLLPLVIVADRNADPAVLPRGGQVRLDLPNSHLGYALTWFGLAGVLVVIYGILILRGRVKKD